jgi:D-xylose transport system substrate-binding protein
MDRRVSALVSVAALALAACTAGAPPTAAPTGTQPTATGPGGTGCVVGVSWNNYQQPRWAAADEPAIVEAVEAGGGSYIRADARDSEDQQITDVQNLINQGADVLIILAKDTEAILPAVQAAKDAGIPMIGYDRLIEDEEVLYITFDNQGVGVAMAEVMLEEVPTGNYAIIKGHAADPNADFLREGFDIAGLADKVEAGDITIVYEEYTDGWRTEAAQANMEAALAAADNDIQAVLSENDSMAIGVVAALDREGLAGEVPVSGQDGDPANLNNVAKGLQLVDVWKDAFGLGETAGNAAIQLCNGASIDEITAPDTLGDHVRPDTLEVTDFETPGGNTVKSIILKPTPITQENLDLVVDLGWISQDELCRDVDPDTGPPACQ